MQAVNPAARRFYRLFYQWTILSSLPPAQGAPHRVVHASGFHTTERRAAGEVESRQRADQIPPSEEQYDVVRRRVNELFETPVQTESERPFSALQPCEKVTRFREGQRARVEYAVSGIGLNYLQNLYGSRLENWNKRHKHAQLQLQSNTKLLDVQKEANAENTLHSILATGTPNVIYSALCRLDLSIANSITAEERPIAETPALTCNTPTAWFNDPVQTTNDKPSSEIALGEQIVRFRSDTRLVLEFVMDDKTLRELEKEKLLGPNLAEVSNRTKAVIEVQKLEYGQYLFTRSIMLSGTFRSVELAWSHICSVRGYVEKMALRNAVRPESDRVKSLGDASRSASDAGSRTASSASIVNTPATGSVNGRPTQVVSKGPKGSTVEDEAVKRVRMAMRALTNPVVVITSTMSTHLEPAADTDDAIQAYRGVTVSSFNTVSLDPVPIFSFNLKIPSRTWDAIRLRKKIHIHFLSADGKGAGLAHLFTQRYDNPARPFEILHKRRSLRPSLSDPPQMRFPASQSSVLFEFPALILDNKCVRVGDHIIVVAALDRETNWGHETEPKASEPTCLSYGGGQYRKFGSELTPRDLSKHEVKSTSDGKAVPQKANSSSRGLSGQRNLGYGRTDFHDPRGSNKVDRHEKTMPQGAYVRSRDLGAQNPYERGRPAFDSAERFSKVQTKFLPIVDEHESTEPRDRNISGDTDSGHSRASGDRHPSTHRAVHDNLFPPRNSEMSSEDIDAWQIMDDLDRALGSDDESGHQGRGDGADEANLERSLGSVSRSDVSRTNPPSTSEDAANRESYRDTENERSITAAVGSDAQDKSSVRDSQKNAPERADPGGFDDLFAEKASYQECTDESTRSSERVTPEDPFDKSLGDNRRADEGSMPSSENRDRPASPHSAAFHSSGVRARASEWGLSSIFGNRSFSTISQANIDKRPQTRRYSSKSNSNLEELIESGSNQTTVSDWLGLPDDDRPYHGHRLARIVRLEKDARAAERRLVEESELLTDAERTELEHTIAANDRIVAKKLAWNAVDDLRIMLNKGRVNYDRAAFLEQAIEKGMAINLDEARQLREMFEAGKLDLETFERVKKHLEVVEQRLGTEAMRLREIGGGEED